MQVIHLKDSIFQEFYLKIRSLLPVSVDSVSPTKGHELVSKLKIKILEVFVVGVSTPEERKRATSKWINAPLTH